MATIPSVSLYVRAYRQNILCPPTYWCTCSQNVTLAAFIQFRRVFIRSALLLVNFNASPSPLRIREEFRRDFNNKNKLYTVSKYNYACGSITSQVKRGTSYCFGLERRSYPVCLPSCKRDIFWIMINDQKEGSHREFVTVLSTLTKRSILFSQYIVKRRWCGVNGEARYTWNKTISNLSCHNFFKY